MAFEVSLSFDQNNRELISKVRQMKQTVKREKEVCYRLAEHTLARWISSCSS